MVPNWYDIDCFFSIAKPSTTSLISGFAELYDEHKATITRRISKISYRKFCLFLWIHHLNHILANTGSKQTRKRRFEDSASSSAKKRKKTETADGALYVLLFTRASAYNDDVYFSPGMMRVRHCLVWNLLSFAESESEWKSKTWFKRWAAKSLCL